MNWVTTFAIELIDPSPLPQPEATGEQVNTFFDEVFIAVGAIAVLLLIIAGLRYITAQGDPAKITQAKNMIMYTIVGVIIAAMAAAIVNFILRNI